MNAAKPLSNGTTAAKKHQGPGASAKSGGASRNGADSGADPDIAGVLGANVDKLAAASFRYHREVRDFVITRRRIAPDGTEGDDWTQGIGESAAQGERHRLMELEADFRLALSCLAADVRYSRDSLIELLVFSHGPAGPEMNWGSLESLMDIAAQWERCAERCHFSDPAIAELPSASQVFEIIGEVVTLTALVRELRKGKSD